MLSFCAGPASAQCPTPGGVCATPGKDGAAGTLTGVVNAYYRGTNSPAAGATTITLGTANANGAQTAIASGDLLLVIQMQGADITSTNSTAYGDGSTGSGYTVNGNLTAGHYEFVKANSAVAVTGGTRNLTIIGGGTGTGLINGYANANSTGAHGAQRFQ
ncbi:MAG: isopeptide-forming domain-containing fimbrial protein, partial [Blastocatellia bacterium]